MFLHELLKSCGRCTKIDGYIDSKCSCKQNLKIPVHVNRYYQKI